MLKRYSRCNPSVSCYIQLDKTSHNMEKGNLSLKAWKCVRWCPARSCCWWVTFPTAHVDFLHDHKENKNFKKKKNRSLSYNEEKMKLCWGESNGPTNFCFLSRCKRDTYVLCSLVCIFCWYTLIRALPLVYTVYRWAYIGSRKLVTPRYAITFLYNIKSDSNFYYSIPVAFSFFFFPYSIQFNRRRGGKKSLLYTPPRRKLLYVI
jgi:hypothetical protein